MASSGVSTFKFQDQIVFRRTTIEKRKRPWLLMERIGKIRTTPEHRKRRVKFCPKCGSTDISWASGLAQLWSVWECRNCGYYGAFIVEDGKLSQKLQEEYVRKSERLKKQETCKDGELSA